jgi:hypothetical protein
MAATAPDFLISGCGTVWTVTPLNADARAWVAANVDAEPYQWLGPVLAVAYSCVEALVAGAQADGLTFMEV